MEIAQLFLANAAILVGAFVLLWLICLGMKDVTPVDSSWALGMVVVAASTFVLTDGNPERKLLLLTLCAVWGIRLGWYMLWRWRHHGPDRRYVSLLDKAKRNRGWGFGKASLLLVFATQAPLLFIVCLPVQLGQLDAAPPLGLLAYVGAALAVFGIVFESLADYQLVRFKADAANTGKVMDRGLWRYTRHPNHFGDACAWWGIYLVAAETATGVWSIIGPILLTWTLMKWSGAPTVEGSMRRKKPDYEGYMQRTAAFFPLAAPESVIASPMTYKVIQWATGAMGKTCLQAVIDHPAMELVGLYVYGAAKAGKDAGAIARREPVGVVATSDVEEILALDADVVIHCARILPPFGSHDADIVRLLESGKNVISINGYSDPGRWDSVRQAMLAAACAKGNSTLMGAGLNPGYAAEQLAVVATGACSQVDRVDITEYVDCRAVKHPEYVFGSLGFGSDPATTNPNDASWGPASLMNGMYGEVLSAMAERLNVQLQRVETEHRVFAAVTDLEIAAGVIPQGRVSHVNWRWAGYISDQRRLTLSIHWFMETTHLANAAPPLWEIDIVGQPCVHLKVEVEKHPEDESRVTAEQLGLAGAVINAIPVVCNAPSGLCLRPVATPIGRTLAVGDLA